MTPVCHPRTTDPYGFSLTLPHSFLLVPPLRFTGEAPLPGSSEVMSDNTRVVEVAKPGPKCPNNVCQATNTAAAPAGVEDSYRTQRV